MAFCKMADLIYAAFPLRALRGLLIRGHIERCPRCQARLLSREEAKGLLVAPDQVGPCDALWQGIIAESLRPAAAAETRPARAQLVGQWAAAAAAVVVALTAFWLLREVEKPGLGPDPIGPAGRFQIGYVNVGGAPAQTFVYQPQGTDTVFVWAIKNP